MPLIDIDKLLSEISPDEPCGPDLEYDPDFKALQQDAEGTPAKYTPDGQLVEDGEDPNWRDIRDRCVSMFERTLDLRVAMLLADALLCQHGVEGLRDGLALIKAMHEQCWEHYHPQLDPDDGNDPLMRMNLIASLAAPIGRDGDPLRFQQRLREVPLARSRQIGSFSLRDLMIATGDLPASAAAGDTPPNEQLIEAAFRDTDGDELKNAGEAATEAVSISKDLDQWVTNKVGASNAANLSPWHDLVGDLNKRLGARVAARFPGETSPAVDSGDAAPDHDGGTSGGRAPAPAAGLSGGVHSRDDVLKALNKVLEYYAAYEPSSPVPMLIRRAQRLVTMDFVDIIRDLSPAAIDQLRVIGGEEAVTASSGPVSTAPPPAPVSGTPSNPDPVSAPAAPPASADEPVRLSASDFAPRS